MMRIMPRAYASFQPMKIAPHLERWASGAGWKRLGFLAERLWPRAGDIVRLAARRRTKGVIRLDPGRPERGPIQSRWGLGINIDVG